MRYDYASFKTFQKAADYLEDMFATGDVCWGEKPEIVRRGNRFVITLEG